MASRRQYWTCPSYQRVAIECSGIPRHSLIFKHLSALRPRTANAADPIAVNALDLERTGARTIVRADAIDGVERQIGAPARGLPHNTSLSRARSISGGSRRRR